MADREPVVTASGIKKTYDREVLSGVDLKIYPGDFLAVLGPSGTGKSTLLNILGLLDRPSEGILTVSGRNAASLSENERAHVRNNKIGFVLQFDSLLPEFTVLENVLMPARIGGKPLDPTKEKAFKLLEMLGIESLSERLPTGLSGGEKQRTAIARALINDPAVLLADEPTGNLDRPNAELVFSKMKELTDSLPVAVVMVTHNEHAAEYASRPVQLRDGRITDLTQ